MSRLGKYEVLDAIGTGSMGTVYRARDTSLDREIALKVIRTGVDTDPEIRERFFREARACARLQHPNIITVHDLGESGQTAYIAMELLIGCDFRAIIKDKSFLPLEKKIEAAAEICDAVAHAHKHGVIHRDVKPSNLFLVSEGHAKVLDFGIARLPSSQLTVAGKILGTPNYMAPEQILGNPSDGRADLFSVAVFLFELLTYVHPFHDSVIPRRIVQGEPDSLFDHDSRLPVVLDRLMCRGLAREPSQRYRTGDEFAADLRAVLDAMRLNSSPTFSRIELPSQRALPDEPSAHGIGEIVPASPVPAGREPAEWHLSEALRLLPEFEATLERKDAAKAQELMREMEASLGDNSVYREALQLSRTRLQALLMAAPPNVAAEPAPVERQPVPAPAGSRAEAVKPPSPAAQWVQKARQLYEDLVRRLPDRHDVQHLLTRLRIQGNRKLMAIAGAVGLSVLLIILAFSRTRVPRTEPSVASGVVSAATAIVRDAPGSAGRIGSLIHGSRVNLLAPPTTPQPEWVHVQPVVPKVLAAGYMRAADLTDWHATGAHTAYLIARNLGRWLGGTPPEMEDQIGSLKEVVARFKDQPEAKDAHVDIAELELAVAGKTAGVDDGWRAKVQDALEQLAAVDAEPRLQSRVQPLRAQALAMLAPTVTPIVQPPAPEPIPRPSPPLIDVAKTLDEAQNKFDDGYSKEAEQLLYRVLGQERQNARAKEMLATIKRAREFGNQPKEGKGK